MIDRINSELLAWLRTHTDADVRLSPPSSQAERNTINVYLLKIENIPPPRGGRKRPPLQLVLHYLVTTRDPDLDHAHRLLWDVIVNSVARSQTDGWAVDFTPLPESAWAAFAVVPQPSVVLGIPVRHEWDQPKLPRITEPLEVESSPTTTLIGKVAGPGNIALAGARLELPSLGLTTETNSKGQFRFASVPGGKNYPREIIVTAKGQKQTIKLTMDAKGKPVNLRFELVEV